MFQKLIYYALFAVVVYFIYTQFIKQYENFSDVYVRDQCDDISHTLDNINTYYDKYCDPNKKKTINEELDCRYYDDKHIYMNTNKKSWCQAPTLDQIRQKIPDELQKYLNQAQQQSNKVNNYYETQIVDNNEIEANQEFSMYHNNKNPYKWELPLANNIEPEPIERKYPYLIREDEQTTLTMIPPDISGFDKSNQYSILDTINDH